MKPKRHYFKDVAALGYVTTDSLQAGQKLDKSKGASLISHSAQRVGAMDALITKGELLKANIARLREERKGKY